MNKYTLNFKNKSITVNVCDEIIGKFSVLKLVKDRQVDLTFFEFDDIFQWFWDGLCLQPEDQIVEHFHDYVINPEFLNFYNVIDYLGIVPAEKIYKKIETNLTLRTIFTEKAQYQFLSPNLRHSNQLYSEQLPEFIKWALNYDPNLINVQDINSNSEYIVIRYFKNSSTFFNRVGDFYIVLRRKDYQPGRIVQCKNVYIFRSNSSVYYHFSQIYLDFTLEKEQIYVKLGSYKIALCVAIKYGDQIYFANDFRRKRKTDDYVVVNIKNTLDAKTYYKIAIKYDDILSKYTLGMGWSELISGYFENTIIFKIKEQYKNLKGHLQYKYYKIKHPIFIDMDKNVNVSINSIDKVEDIIANCEEHNAPEYWSGQLHQYRNWKNAILIAHLSQ